MFTAPETSDAEDARLTASRGTRKYKDTLDDLGKGRAFESRRTSPRRAANPPPETTTATDAVDDAPTATTEAHDHEEEEERDVTTGGPRYEVYDRTGDDVIGSYPSQVEDGEGSAPTNDEESRVNDLSALASSGPFHEDAHGAAKTSTVLRLSAEASNSVAGGEEGREEGVGVRSPTSLFRPTMIRFTLEDRMLPPPGAYLGEDLQRKGREVDLQTERSLAPEFWRNDYGADVSDDSGVGTSRNPAKFSVANHRESERVTTTTTPPAKPETSAPSGNHSVTKKELDPDVGVSLLEADVRTATTSAAPPSEDQFSMSSTVHGSIKFEDPGAGRQRQQVLVGAPKFVLDGGVLYHEPHRPRFLQHNVVYGSPLRPLEHFQVVQQRPDGPPKRFRPPRLLRAPIRRTVAPWTR